MCEEEHLAVHLTEKDSAFSFDSSDWWKYVFPIHDFLTSHYVTMSHICLIYVPSL